MGRIVALWIFGLVGSTIAGGIVGSALTHDDTGTFFGLLGGCCIFACVRLWLAPQRPAREPRPAHPNGNTVVRFGKWIAGPLAFFVCAFAVQYGMRVMREFQPGLEVRGDSLSSTVQSASA